MEWPFVSFCIYSIAWLVFTLYCTFFKVGSDYLGEEFNVTFSAGNNMASFLIPIVDDDIFEMMEDFNLELFIPNSSFVQGVRPGSPDTALVTIMDEASKYKC